MEQASHYLLLLLLFNFHLLCSSTDPIGSYCSSAFNDGSTKANIKSVLADLAAQTPIDAGFSISTYGKGAATIYGLGQCRGDVPADDCASCIADAAKQLPLTCPSQADARIWYDYCFMRYDNDNFIGQSDTSQSVILINVEDADNPKAFVAKVGSVMTKARAIAVVPGNGGLGRVQVKFSPYVTIYGLAWCTRDLSELTCGQCLADAIARLPDYCSTRRGCRIVYSSCTARYEIYPFFFPVDSSTLPTGAAAAAAQAKYEKVVLHS